MLFEESGIILGTDEQIVMRGKCRGKVPEKKIVEGFARQIIQIQWNVIDGELILTNRRAFALAKVGMIQKTIKLYELGIIGAAVKKLLFGKEVLTLFLDVGQSQTKSTELEVDNPADWANKIKEVVSNLPSHSP